MRTFPPFGFWKKFKECEITQAGRLPFFCLNMLYVQDVLDLQGILDSEYTSVPIPNKTVWQAYWYCLN